MNVFVTGGGGFLGKSLLGTLQSDSQITVHAPSSAECNLTQDSSLGPVFRSEIRLYISSRSLDAGW